MFWFKRWRHCCTQFYITNHGQTAGPIFYANFFREPWSRKTGCTVPKPFRSTSKK
ncbi:unnamed protein product, partial [Nesidiocoris tenuis]